MFSEIQPARFSDRLDSSLSIPQRTVKPGLQQLNFAHGINSFVDRLFVAWIARLRIKPRLRCHPLS
jgi:hypothetical protein